MEIFAWIVLGLFSLLLGFSGICWIVYITNENSDWRRLAVKTFRHAMVVLLLFVNVFIYARLVSDL